MRLLWAVVTVELKADYKHGQVLMRHLGKKPSATSSRELSQGDTVYLSSGHVFWLLPNKYKHTVKFCDTSESSTAAAGRKRSAEDAGVFLESPSKRHPSASTSLTNSDKRDDIGDREQDSDTEHVEMVCICF